jgi:membrane-associated phospholipid phosphatase
VLLDVHWLSDVIAGLAVGSAWFCVCAIAFGGRLLRFGAPAEQAEREHASYIQREISPVSVPYHSADLEKRGDGRAS